MNYYIKPEMTVAYFGGSEILTNTSTGVLPPLPNPNYAANNMNHYMVGTTVKALQTRTAAIEDIMKFN